MSRFHDILRHIIFGEIHHFALKLQMLRPSQLDRARNVFLNRITKRCLFEYFIDVLYHDHAEMKT